MRKHYDFSEGVPNPYAHKLKEGASPPEKSENEGRNDHEEIDNKRRRKADIHQK